jgi:hypothetical protein
MEKKWLEAYDGQTIAEILALKHDFRIDSLVLAVEQAIQNRPGDDLSETEKVVLAVEGMEREVNNGGYHQFFCNLSGEFTFFLVHALEEIKCPITASISAEAIAALDLPETFDHDMIIDVALALPDSGWDALHKLDKRYYQNPEDIAQRLFDYIELHQSEIRIPAI